MLSTTGLRPRLTPEAEKEIGDSPPPGRGFSFTLIIFGSFMAKKLDYSKNSYKMFARDVERKIDKWLKAHKQLVKEGGSMHARSYVLTQADKLIKKLLYYRSKALGETGDP